MKTSAGGEPTAPSVPAVDEVFVYGGAALESWLFVVDDRADEQRVALRAAFFEELERVETDPNRGCGPTDPAAPRPVDRRVAFAVPSEGGALVEAPELDLRTDRVTDPGIPGILSFHDARRFWVLASFSLRSGAHVDTYAPLRCSRKPRQNRKLAGRAFLKVLGMRTRVSRPGSARSRHGFESRSRSTQVARSDFWKR
jgi:hypothetical protein